MCEHVPNGPGQVRATHWQSGVLLLGKTEDPKNYPVVSPCLTMCDILLHAAARKCGTPVIITSPCQQPSSPAHRVGSWSAGRSFGFDHLQFCNASFLDGWSVCWENGSPHLFKLHENWSNTIISYTIVQGGQASSKTIDTMSTCSMSKTRANPVACSLCHALRIRAV